MIGDVLLIVVLYGLPALFTALFHWFNEETKTVGDFLEYLWVTLLPIFNLIILFAMIIDFFLEKIKLNDSWNNFKNRKIK